MPATRLARQIPTALRPAQSCYELLLQTPLQPQPVLVLVRG